MKLKWLTIAVSACALLLIGGVAHSAVRDECLGGLKPALMSGEFSGSIDCQNDQLSIEKVGYVRTHWGVFTVYSYRYKLSPACADCAVHGGRRIIFMDGDHYVGQYKSDFVRAVIRHGRLVLEADNQEPVAVEFSRHGPPRELLVDGELIHFFK